METNILMTKNTQWAESTNHTLQARMLGERHSATSHDFLRYLTARMGAGPAIRDR